MLKVFTRKSTPTKTAVLNCAREKAKGGRAKKSKRGGGKHTPENLDDTRKNTTGSTKTITTDLKERVTTLQKCYDQNVTY